ncbi:MAG: site-specific integrase [Bacillaceae bacterium]|nr:site-specific integrase [Bacillaceae bacterium]
MGVSLSKATLDYFGVSDSSRARQIQKTLEFFSRFPKVIKVESSRMANPAYVIDYLANNLVGAEAKYRVIRNRFVVGFLFWTGVRVNEILKTERKDLDLIIRTYNVPTLKQRKVAYRPIPLDHVPLKELKLWNEYLSKSPFDNLVQLSDREVERVVKAVLGSEYTPHMLRHALGLWLYEYSKDVRLVAQILRHTNIANTLIYTRLSMDAIREKLRLE